MTKYHKSKRKLIFPCVVCKKEFTTSVKYHKIKYKIGVRNEIILDKCYCSAECKKICDRTFANKKSWCAECGKHLNKNEIGGWYSVFDFNISLPVCKPCMDSRGELLKKERALDTVPIKCMFCSTTIQIPKDDVIHGNVQDGDILCKKCEKDPAKVKKYERMWEVIMR